MLKNTYIKFFWVMAFVGAIAFKAQGSEESLANFMLRNNPMDDISGHVKEFISKGVDLNKKGGTNEQTPLMIAAERYWSSIPPKGQANNLLPAQKVYKALVYAPGVEINVQDKNGKTAIMYLVENTPSPHDVYWPNRPILDLIGKGAVLAIKDNDGKMAVDYAKAEATKNFLLEWMKPEDARKKVRLVSHGSIIGPDMLARILNSKTYNDRYAVSIPEYIATDVGIENGADFNIPLNDSLQTVLMYLAYSYWKKFRGQYRGRLLFDRLAQWSKVNMQDAYGRTALMYLGIGASEVDPDVLAPFKLLLANGADVNLKDKEGKAAIDYANNAKVRNYLLEKSAVKQRSI